MATAVAKGIMQKTQLNEAKVEIRSVLLTYKESVSLGDFLKAYKNLLGRRLPSQALGFPSDVAFLQSLPDVVDVTIDASGKTHLSGIADKASQHIQKLVRRQRTTKSSNSKPKTKNRQPYNNSQHNNNRQSVSKKPGSFNVRNLPPFLPGTLKAEILQLMSIYSSGITFSAFVVAYKKKFNKAIPLVKGFESLEGLINQIPELELRNENNEMKIYQKCSFASSAKSTDKLEKVSYSKQTGDLKKELFQEKSCHRIHESGISEDILQDFNKVLETCPDGILDVHFLPVCKKITGKSFDLHELGYTNLAELIDALPDIFKRVKNPNDDRQWLVYPAKTLVKIEESSEAKNSSPFSVKVQTPQQPREGIPSNASPPAIQYINPTISKCISLNEYVPIFISAIVDPSLFWFQLQTDEAIENFEKLEKEMETFYNANSETKYRMKNSDIAINATCVIQCPEDLHWYRAVIKSIPCSDLVNVLFVDYGGRQDIPRENVYYVRSEYHELPAYAFRAQLAGLKLPENISCWSLKARNRFIQLCNSASVMAYILPMEDGAHPVYLCDTSGETDLHINDILTHEGYAEFVYQAQANLENGCFSAEPDNISNGYKMHDNSDSELTSSSGQSLSLSDINEKLLRSRTKVNRKLSFSAEEEKSFVEPPVSSLKSDQKSKRYVKVVDICEDNKFHIINFEDKLFLSCGDLCRLLWKEKNPDFLLERLTFKEIDIPFLKLVKDDHAELFRQLLWYKVPDVDKLNSNESSLFLCPLKEAIFVLNIFGHQSICLRLIIEDEMKRFDPHDAFWKDFICEDTYDTKNIQNGYLEEINKLCLYDLKAKLEALRIKKLKLQRNNSVSQNEEMEKIENLQSVIQRRMKQIEAICIKYSTS